MITVRNGATNGPVREAVLFAFDDHSIPFTTGLKLDLVPGKEPGSDNPIVVGRGLRAEDARLYAAYVRDA